MEEETPTFVINHPSFLGLPVDQEDEVRIEKYYKKRTCPKIKSFYVHGELENRLGFDICTFVSGEIKDVKFQDAKIFDSDDKIHDAKIVLVHDKEDNIYGYLVSPKEDLELTAEIMEELVYKFKCI